MVKGGACRWGESGGRRREEETEMGAKDDSLSR